MGIFRWRRFKSMPESITGKTKTTARNLPAGLREPVNGGLPPVAALRQGILWLFLLSQVCGRQSSGHFFLLQLCGRQ